MIEPYNYTPARVFSRLEPLEKSEQLEAARNRCLEIIYGHLQAKGEAPSSWDIRPLVPDDLRMADPQSGFYEDWRVNLGHLKNTDGVTGNPIVKGTMLPDRYIILYGASIQTPQYTVPETKLTFKNGSNIKCSWFITEMVAFNYRRFISPLTPFWKPSEQITVELATVRNTDLIVDELFGLVAEPIGTSFTMSNSSQRKVL